MPIAAVTRLRLRSLRFVPLLIVAAIRARRQARTSDGCLAADTRTERGRVFWTRTLWRDAAAMHGFARRDAHGAAMPRLQDWCDEASVVHFEHGTLPDWDEAEARLRDAGRVSRVRHPSPAHARGETVPAG